MKKRILQLTSQVTIIIYSLWFLGHFIATYFTSFGKGYSVQYSSLTFLPNLTFSALLFIGLFLQVLYFITKNKVFLYNAAMVFVNTYGLITVYLFSGYILSSFSGKVSPILQSVLIATIIWLISFVFYIISKKEVFRVELVLRRLKILLTGARIIFFVIFIISVLIVLRYFIGSLYTDQPPLTMFNDINLYES